jgi:hypothetical protein
MKISRRKFLKLAGSGIAIVVLGGTVWRAFANGVFSSGQGPAYEPWKEWKTESEEGTGPLSLVASAILAANPHNTQPWLFVQALFTFRIGYPTIEASSSPRRSVQEVVVSHI